MGWQDDARQLGKDQVLTAPGGFCVPMGFYDFWRHPWERPDPNPMPERYEVERWLLPRTTRAEQWGREARRRLQLGWLALRGGNVHEGRYCPDDDDW